MKVKFYEEKELNNMELNEIEMIEYIFEKLLSEGVVVTREDISKVLDYEFQYMVENGFAQEI